MKIKPASHTANRKLAKIKSIICAFGLLSVVFFSLSRFSDKDTTIDTINFLKGKNEEKLRLEITDPPAINKEIPEMSYNDPAFLMNSIPAPDYHLVVSTGCSSYQNWQMFAFFFHAFKSGQVQNSYVTRVVSGCSEKQAKEMNEVHEREIASIAPGRFFIHHTPSFEGIKPKVNYRFFNKPFGVRHWMENALRYPYNHQKYDNVTFILLDPDQIILRPFTNDLTNESEQFGGPFTDKRIVKIGQPFAQEYALGTQFLSDLKEKMDEIAPKKEIPSPVAKLSKQDQYAYMVGPPYVMKGYDMWRIIKKWSDFASYVYEQKPEHLAEMYAYSLAAAHLKLPHQVVQTFMISNAVVFQGEGWSFIDKKKNNEVCSNVKRDEMPYTLHFCQVYGLGKHLFSKYHLPTNFMGCKSPLLLEPPNGIATKYKYMISPDKNERRDFKSPKVVRRMAFALCQTIKSLNEAAIYYKDTQCPPGTANFNKTLAFFDNMTSV